VIALAAEDLDVDDDSLFAVWQSERYVASLFGLLTEDGDDQPLFSGHLNLALRRNLSDQNVFRPYFGADSDDPVLVQILERVLSDVWNVSRDLFRTQLGIDGFRFVSLDVD